MYTGKIMLSFCPDTASSADPSPIIIPYRTIFTTSTVCHHHSTRRKLTENSSTNPQTRNAHANATTESVNPALPSNVLGVVGDHLYRPIRLPTTDAYIRVISPPTVINTSESKLTTASPTPIVKIPVYISKREGLWQVSVSEDPHDPTPGVPTGNSTYASNHNAPAHPVSR